MRDRYLMLIAILTVLLNFVSLSGDFIFAKLLVDQTNHVVGTAASLMKTRKAYIGFYYASYYQWTNAVSFIIQTFFVSRIYKWFGVRGSMFALPVFSLATFVTILANPILQVVRVLKIAENSTNYSLQNTVRAALLLPTSREAKYKAKAAIETFRVRLGGPKTSHKSLAQLLENASKYSPPEEPITVSVEMNGDFVMTSVIDRGNGIDTHEHHLIFDELYRGKDQRHLVQGTGMGLPIAKAIR